MKIQEIEGNQVPKPGKKKLRKKLRRKKKKRNFKFLKHLFFIVLFLTLFILAALSPLFEITKIEVGGSSHYKKEDIIGVTDLKIGNNAFKTIGSNPGNIILLRYGKNEKVILDTHPYIKSAVVRLVLPGKVRIELTERIPMATVSFLGTNLLMDQEGVIIDTLDKINSVNKPQIIGLKFDKFEIGKGLSIKNKERFDTVKKVIDSIDKIDKNEATKFSNSIKSIDITDANKIFLSIDSRIMVNLGDTKDLDYKITYMRQIITKNLKKDDKGYLDFTIGENPSFMPE